MLEADILHTNTTLTNFSVKYLVMHEVYTDVVILLIPCLATCT